MSLRKVLELKQKNPNRPVGLEEKAYTRAYIEERWALSLESEEKAK